MTTVDFSVLAAPLAAQELTKERSRATTSQLSFARLRSEAEAETRLRKICAEAAAPRLSGLERTALLVFGASVALALASSAFECYRLFSSGALDQIVRALLNA